MSGRRWHVKGARFQFSVCLLVLFDIYLINQFLCLDIAGLPYFLFFLGGFEHDVIEENI